MADISYRTLSTRQIVRLKGAMDDSRSQLEIFRKNRLNAIRQFCGTHYSNDGSSAPTPVNLIAMATNIYLTLLAANAPRYMVTTRHKRLKSDAILSELAMNHLVHETDLGNTLYDVVMDSLYCMGIAKVGLERYAVLNIGGFSHDLCQPFVDHVLLDDWVHDMAAKKWDNIDYAGNRYQIPYEEAMANPMYASEAKDEYVKFERPNATADDFGIGTSEQLSQGTVGNTGFRDWIQVWDLWLPREKLLVTMQDKAGSVPMRVVEWEGPDEGPFRTLWYDRPPGNIMPVAPAAHWVDIHNIANSIYAKLADQAEQEKTVLGVAGPAAEDGRRVEDARDGQMIRLDNPNLVNTFHYGGISQQSFALAVHLLDEFSRLNGNLDMLGGLGAQAQTAAQEQIMQGNASKRIESMQAATLKFDKAIGHDLFWYLHTDPLIELPLTYRVPNTEIDVPVSYSAQEREGDFLEYNFDVDAYSVRYTSPSTKAAAIRAVLQECILPFLGTGVLEQQGIQLDLKGLVKTMARLNNVPELEDFVKFMDTTGMDDPSAVPIGEQPQKKAPNTTRTYERVNRPGATMSGKREGLIQKLIGGRMQPAQEAATMRPVG